MKKRLALAATATLAVLGVMPSPAEASVVIPNRLCDQAFWADDDFIVAPGESLCWPQDRHEVVIEGPAKVWGMRSVARSIDAQVGGLTIHSLPTDKCATYPEAFCVRVTHKSLGPNLLGQFDFADWPSTNSATVGLSTDYARKISRREKKITAGHELLHTLGFTHHSGKGLIGLFPQPTASATEIALLKSHYGA